jgi:hypothetical protein
MRIVVLLFSAIAVNGNNWKEAADDAAELTKLDNNDTELEEWKKEHG